MLQTSSWRHLSACNDDYFSEIKCQFSLVWPYICISMVLFNIDNDYRAVRWKVRWCVPFESTNAEYFVQWLFTPWKQIVMFNSCILMYTCTVRLMRWLWFFGYFFFYKLLFLLSGFLQILKLLNLHVWKFHIFWSVFSNWNQKIRNQKKKSPLMNACFRSYFWQYYITQLNSMNFF